MLRYLDMITYFSIELRRVNKFTMISDELILPKLWFSTGFDPSPKVEKVDVKHMLSVELKI